MRIPSATYRVQFNANFRFTDAEALVPYLHDLGITDLYASPRFKARKGSSHGYDVADPLRVNSELGTEEEFDRLTATLRQYNMGLLLDIVPNHMAVSTENPWWLDVLENGRESRYARFFDVDWHPQGPKVADLLRNRVILPILQDAYRQVLINQGIRLRLDDRGFFIEYQDDRFPINPRTYSEIFAVAIELCTGKNEVKTTELEKLGLAASNLPRGDSEFQNFGEESEKARAELKAAVRRLYQSDDVIRKVLDDTLLTLNGVSGDMFSFDRLDSLLNAQTYRLADWHLASREINYRRFFDINDLIGLRTEDPVVFAARHGSIMRLIQEGKVSGLRVDHIDGLFDPLEYLERLKSIPVSDAVENGDASPIYTVVEKITCGRETLPPEWPISGSTGYDFLNAVNSVFIDQSGYRAIEKSYREFTRLGSSFADTWYVRNKEVMEELFPTDVNRLTHRLAKLAALWPLGRDLPAAELTEGLKEITACLPVYRTYYRDAVLRAQDRISVEQALSTARGRTPALRVSGATWSFLRKVFLAELSFTTEMESNCWLDFIMRWQQFTGAVMAKGLEDSALFARPSLISVNEVGNNPFHSEIRFGSPAFHEFNSRALQNHPHSLSATSTHDTKWSEDVRARLNVLSEIPDEWRKCLTRWSAWNKSTKTKLGKLLVPTPNEETILYQAMLGIWPITCSKNMNRGELTQRIEQFFIKSAKEARTYTSWISPDEPHETALRKFVRSILGDSGRTRFLDDFLALHRKLAFYGALNSLSQLILKMTSPGVPDFYQGSEIWNFRLTDPDNRQPVDFKKRIEMLDELKSRDVDAPNELFHDLLNHWCDGRIKLYLTTRILQFRRAHQELFSNGRYLPIRVEGKSECLHAFARCAGQNWVVIAVPRLVTKIAAPGTYPVDQKTWRSTALVLPPSAPECWVDVLSRESLTPRRRGTTLLVPLSAMFRDLPFGILAHVPSDERKN
ncbi:MAG TPA: malto-oligosyltrehalose synthase [Candidatus Acidoferrales bacterium]|nr:malto-oligosyltrehalose synthase [Candidatus Acidoferrales bacterium]